MLKHLHLTRASDGVLARHLRTFLDSPSTVLPELFRQPLLSRQHALADLRDALSLWCGRAEEKAEVEWRRLPLALSLRSPKCSRIASVTNLAEDPSAQATVNAGHGTAARARLAMLAA
eukprot:6310804-Prymnesium_polylepis.1